MKKIKVLIVDDSQLIRELLTSILDSDPRLEVVGCAVDPHQARQMIKDLSPDVITLDVEMPRMNGITFLKNLMRLRPMPVVMISTLTSEGSQITMQALELGAIDFIEKPNNISEMMADYRDIIINKVITAASVSKTKLLAYQNRLKAEEHVKHQPIDIQRARILQIPSQPTNKIIAIGGSTGGLEALRALLEAVKFSGSESIVVVLHLPAGFTQSYARRLNQCLPVTVKEAEDKERILPGHIYIAPGGLHLSIKRRAVGYQCIIEDGEKVNRHKPSVDVLFDSVAKEAKNDAMGIILTGMGNDGARGLKHIFDAGGETYAQNEESSVVWGMPGTAVAAGAVPSANIRDLSKIASVIPPFAKR
ncbi:chemotaxis response regulator protein-glutamate methylesterase [Paraneptunicella aestuarii]|uniref:protein-glutamate methylesterase/protein-glutamine glutaminase n=1 Tax=Paraneptunicella aestuarii TaxID=2831148 RepID=UPI001E3A7766|nr:chemotaxis response regulator protein-glutamate methylesterase [Paraneptunicella aestuarii]UAA38752.1 chemotaxis response regulator protein-glutamate methylesterase [Paraneptunicella aestuarii]